MKSLAKPLIYVLFTSLSFSQTLLGIGKWYSRAPVPAPLLPETEEQEINVVDLYNSYDQKNILYYQGQYYINNAFPICEDTVVKDFAKICLQKNLLSQEEFDLIKFADAILEDHFLIPNEKIIDYANAFEKFILCITYHVQCICQDDQLTNKFTKLYCKAQNMRTFYALKSLVELLTNRNFMKAIWKHMHTEPLMAFDNFYKIKNLQTPPKIIRRKKPLVFISYIDMCESCEEFIERFSHFPSVPRQTYQRGNPPFCSYKTLVGSFKECKDLSRSRNSNNPDLLKVPLEFPNSILLEQDSVSEQNSTENEQINTPTPLNSNPQSTETPLPGNKRQRTKEPTPLQPPQSQQPSLLPRLKFQPINIPVILPTKPDIKPVFIDAIRRPIKKAKTSSPTSSETNIIPKSPASAPANSAPAPNVQDSSNNQSAPRPIQSGNNQPTTNK